MVRRLLALLLVFLLAVPSGALAAAKPNSKKIAKIKAKVQKYAATQEPVTVMLGDEKGTELKGTIAEAGDDGFVLAGRKSATSRHLAYGEVSGVGQGHLRLGQAGHRRRSPCRRVPGPVRPGTG